MNYLLFLSLLAFKTSGQFFAEYVEDNRRIVGGKESPSLPFFIQLEIKRSKGGATYCGASLLTPTGAVTAGHCFENSKSITAYIGSAKKFEGMQRKVKSWQLHPNYDPTTDANDIGVLVWKEEITWTAHIYPITIGSQPKSGTQAEVAGFGEIAEKRPSQVLRSVKVKIISDEICKKKTIKKEKFFKMAQPNSYICSYEMPYKGSYYGDSGGPLYLNKDKPTLLGVVSWGPDNIEICKDCANIYMSVSYSSQWIQDSIKCLSKSVQEKEQKKCTLQ